MAELLVQLNAERDNLETENIASEAARDTLQIHVDYLETQIEDLRSRYNVSITSMRP